MKKAITQTSLLKMILLLFGALPFHFQTYAQVQPTKLTWDGEVGCRIYEQDKERGLKEDIDSDECIRVCERSHVTYTVSGTNLTSATWNVTGGTVTPNGNGLSASVQWSNMGGGSIEVTVVKQDNSTQVIQNCVEIIASPIALFQVGNSKEPISCLNTELHFINQSSTNGGTALVSYQWDFNDGTYSNEFQPTHTYTSPGVYKVTLSVTNECNCTDTYTIEIKVIDRPNVTIECPTVVCEGFSATYSVNDECKGKWKVEGGTIVNDNGYSIEVLWDHVDESGFGYVSYLSDCTCPVWTTVKVPVVQNVGKIKGLSTICNKSQARYTLPQWPTTDFQWEIVPINGGWGTTIINTDQRNEVVVNALQAGTYLLRCVYKNTLLGCGGVAEFEIEVTDPITIYGDETLLCQNSEGHYFTNHANATWTLKKGTQIVTTQNGANFDYTFAQAGSYVLTAIAPNYCESEPIFITVAPKPTPVQNIENIPTEACLNTSFVFKAVNDDPTNSVLVWSVTGGFFDGSNIGESVSIQFTSPGTQTVTVIKKLKNAPFCESDPVTANVAVKVLAATITNDSGLIEFCASSSTQFTANVNFTEYDHIEWEFTDTNGSPNSIGNIVSGQYTLHPTVSFNQTSNTVPTSSGMLRLTVKKCTEEIIVNFPFTVINSIGFTIVDAPTQICALTDFNVTVQTAMPVTYAEFNIMYSDGNPEEEFIYNGTPTNTITIPFEGFANVPDNIGRTISISAASINGCINNNMVVHSLTVFPSPVVNITSQKTFSVCDPANYSVTVTANMQMNLTNTTLEWYDNTGTLIPENTGLQTITITNGALGEYYVEARAENGCISRDYFKIIAQNCGGSGGSCQTHNNTITITNTEWLDCGTLKITANYTGSPTISWSYNSQYVQIGTTTASGGTATAIFTTNITGVHDIGVAANYGSNLCGKSDITTVDKPYTPDIRFKAVCDSNTNTYTVTLWDNSTYIGTPPGFTLTLSGYGSSSDSPFEISNVSPGIYTAKVSLNGAIICTKEILVDLPQLPNLNDEIDFKQNGISISQTCDTEAVTLVPPISDPNFIYTWLFDGVTNSNVSPTVNLTNSGLVKLTIKTKEGCEYVYSKQIIVKTNGYQGTISGGGPFCETDIVNLEYVPNPLTGTPQSYQWMRFNTPIQNATGSTYTPTESGSYWVVTYTADGCAKYDTPAVNLSIIKAPYVYIQGPDGACKGVPFILNGISESETYTSRWLRNGTAVTNWSGATLFERQFTEQNPGTYTYTLQVRNPLFPNCVGSYTHTVVVSNPPSVPSLSYQILSCSPYRVRLTATSNASQYIWSNGMTGSSIEVTEGGPYKVTAVNGVGCEVSSQFDVPKSPEGYLWIFPTGCYSYCGDKEKAEKIILGPSPYASFHSYRWLENGNTISGGSGAVSELSYMLNGKYQLMLSNGNCDATSGDLRANYNGRCGECKLEVKQELKEIIEKPFIVYQYYLDIYNPNGEAVNVTLESTMGSFSPSSFYIPSGGSTGGILLNFYPNTNFVPGMLEVHFHIQGGEDLQCKYTEMWDVPSARPAGTNPEENDGIPSTQLLNLVVAPNPIKETTTISYELESKEPTNVQLVVYNLMGVQIWAHDSKETSESVVFDASRLSSGQYILILRVNNEFIKQQILIKN